MSSTRREQVLSDVIRYMEYALDPLSTTDIKKHEAKGCFRYIPLHLEWFITQVEAAITYLRPARNHGKGPYIPVKFIDVGCGLGTKVALAKSLGCDAHGIEINRKYVNVARRLLGERYYDYKKGDYKGITLSNKILKGDAKKADFSPYDIIYFYCPQLRNDKLGDLESQLEDQILSTAKQGAVILANLAKNEEFHKEESSKLKRVAVGKNTDNSMVRLFVKR